MSPTSCQTAPPRNRANHCIGLSPAAQLRCDQATPRERQPAFVPPAFAFSRISCWFASLRLMISRSCASE